MIFEQIDLGGDRNFGYLIGDPESKTAAIIDPGANPQLALDAANRHGLRLTWVINTHGHGDHAGGNDFIKSRTGAKVAAHKKEKVRKDLALEDGQTLTIGELRLEVLHTPGHTPGSVCILAGKKLVTGDTLFVGKIGGTGPFFPGSDEAAEYESLKRLMELPDDIEVYPGHNYYGGEGIKRSSTIGEERRTNPFILCKDFDAFCDLKENWEAYKKKHGIR